MKQKPSKAMHAKRWRVALSAGLGASILAALSGCGGDSPVAQVADLRGSDYATFELNNAGQVAWLQDKNARSHLYVDGVRLLDVDSSQEQLSGIGLNDLGQMIVVSGKRNSSRLLLLEGGKTTQVSGGFEMAHDAKINNNGQIVFVGKQGDCYHVYMYEMSYLSSLSEGCGGYIAAQLGDAGHAAWFAVGADNESLDVHLYDNGIVKTINDKEVFTEEEVKYYGRRINGGGQVVWSSDERGDVYDSVVNLYDGNDIVKLSPMVDNKNPAINSSGQVVWQGWDGNDYEILLYDGGRIVQITDNEINDVMPDISDQGVIAWRGNDGHDYEIYTYDGGHIAQLTDNEGDDSAPQINNKGQVAWIGHDADGALLGVFRADPGAGRIIQADAGMIIGPFSTPWVRADVHLNSDSAMLSPYGAEEISVRADDGVPSFSFVAVGDSRLSSGWAPLAHKFPHAFVEGLGAEIAKHNPAFVAFVGDMTTYSDRDLVYGTNLHLDGWHKTFATHLKYKDGRNIPLLPVMGNHESYLWINNPFESDGIWDVLAVSESLGSLDKIISHSGVNVMRYYNNSYYWDHGSDGSRTRFYVIDFYEEDPGPYKGDGVISDGLYAWLKSTMGNAAKENIKNIMVFGHTPLYNPTKKNMKNVVDLFHEHNVRAYFAGHAHVYRHEIIGSDSASNKIVHEYVAGGGGAELEGPDGTMSWVPKQSGSLHPEKSGDLGYEFRAAARKYSYVLVDVYADKIDVTTYITQDDVFKANKLKEVPKMDQWEKHTIMRQGETVKEQEFCQNSSKFTSRKDVIWCKTNQSP